MNPATVALTKAVAHRLKTGYAIQARADQAWYADDTIATVQIPLGSGAFGGGTWFWAPEADGTWRGALVVDGRETVAVTVRPTPRGKTVATDPARVAAAIVRALAKGFHGQ